jgi:hypothetical protein
VRSKSGRSGKCHQPQPTNCVTKIKPPEFDRRAVDLRREAGHGELETESGC